MSVFCTGLCSSSSVTATVMRINGVAHAKVLMRY